MGFIPQVNTKTLYAYLTPKGREYILEGDKVDFQIAYFSLHDDDVNYYVSSNISAGTTYYTLQSGFVPDITGDADSCIKSIAEGTGVYSLATLSGSTIIDPVTGKPTVGPIGSDGNISSRVTTINGPTPTTINSGTLNTGRQVQTFSFSVTISPPVGDTNPVTASEIENSKFYVEILNPPSLIGQFKISGVSTTKILYSPSIASTRIDVEYTVIQSPSTTTNITFPIVITPFNTSSPSTNTRVTYTASYPVSTSTGPTRGTTTTTPDTGTGGGTSFGSSNSGNASSGG